MDRLNVTGLDGTVHQGLLNAHTGFLIDVTCDAGRFAVVQPYDKLVPGQITADPLTCGGCAGIVSGDEHAPRHPADVAREIADIVLADADRRGCVPDLDNEGLERAFQRTAPDAGELSPLIGRLALGVFEGPARWRGERLYDLVQQHLDDLLTARAMEIPDGTPVVMIRYMRYTGGEVMVPVGVGDRLMYDGIASGFWDIGVVRAVENSGVMVDFPGGLQNRWYKRHEVNRWFAHKLDRAPVPATA